MTLFTKGTELTMFGQLKILMMFSINLNLKTFSPFVIANSSLGEERADLSAFSTFVRFVLV